MQSNKNGSKVIRVNEIQSIFISKARKYSSQFLCKTIKQYFTSLNVFILILRAPNTKIYRECYALCLGSLPILSHIATYVNCILSLLLEAIFDLFM